MQIGIPAETVVGENRVAATPSNVVQGLKLPISIVPMNKLVPKLRMMPTPAVN